MLGFNGGRIGVANTTDVVSASGMWSSLEQVVARRSNIWVPRFAVGGDNVYDIEVSGETYRVHEFTTVGTASFITGRSLEVEYLVVAGGGAGSKAHITNTCGGGGAGGVVAGEISVSPNIYEVTVGPGGTCSTSSGNRTGTNGGNSSFYNITSLGGGRGGDETGNGGDGGSGGGAGSYNGTATAARSGGTATQPGSSSGGFGNNGGSYDGTSGRGGCGGGGADGPGQGTGNDGTGTNGGDGISSSITGDLKFYAGGGGSSGWQDNPGGLGGAGGGGNGGTNSTNATNGQANTGSGGGAAKSATLAGNGGSGIVIVRYKIS